MAWTTPKTWVAGNTLTAAELNEQVRDNLDFLYAKPTSISNLDEAANYSTSSTSFVDIDATDLSHTITTGGGDVLVWCSNVLLNATSSIGVYFNIDVNGAPAAADDGIAMVPIINTALISVGTGNYACASFVFVVESLSAGSNTFKLQWKIIQGGYTAYLYAGAGTSKLDLHPQFGVREL